MLVIRRKRKSYIIILIFKSISIEEAIFTSIASTKPAAINRVSKVKKAKYNSKRAVFI